MQLTEVLFGFMVRSSLGTTVRVNLATRVLGRYNTN